jgi:hypothetical protein
MGPQMNTILLLLIFTGLVGTLLVVFFMLDRVNELHKHADIKKGHIDPKALFGGLSGKNLWDALIGVPMPGWDQKKIALIRPRYEIVLQKHLELLFEDGKLDAREGYAMPIRCERMVPTLRGDIESWIPHEFASGIYRAGFAIANTPEDGHETIRVQIDMIGDALFAATGLPSNPLSATLLPHLDRPEPDMDDEELLPEDEASIDGTDGTAAEGSTELAALPAPESPEILVPVIDATPAETIAAPQTQEAVEAVTVAEPAAALASAAADAASTATSTPAPAPAAEPAAATAETAEAEQKANA